MGNLLGSLIDQIISTNRGQHIGIVDYCWVQYSKWDFEPYLFVFKLTFDNT